MNCLRFVRFRMPLAAFLFTASLLLAFSLPHLVSAEELVDAIHHVQYGGHTILDGDTVAANQFTFDETNPENLWSFSFNWPHVVPADKGYLMFFKGTFGDLDGTPFNEVANLYEHTATNGAATGNTIWLQKGAWKEAFGLESAVIHDVTIEADIVESGEPRVRVGIGHASSLGGTPTVAVREDFCRSTTGFGPHTFELKTPIDIDQLPGDDKYVIISFTFLNTGGSCAGGVVKSPNPQFRSSGGNLVPYAYFYSFTNFIQQVDLDPYLIINGTNTADVPPEEQNYSINTHGWTAFNGGEFEFSKSFPFPELGNTATSGTYTAVIAEGDGQTASPAGLAEWFASGGTTGTAPIKHAFLTFEYDAETVQECCSSVVFLPGFEGSILRTGSNTLWPPTLFDEENDLDALRLDDSGDPITPGITVEGIIDDFYGVGVYGEFRTFMDTLVSNNTIAEWYPLAYDWRFPPQKIINDGINTPDGHIDVVDLIETIADQSDTGQVTFIAHSNGGLLAKAIIKDLEVQGKESLIDSLVMVGTPQLGTPQAVGGLLHGEGSDIGKWYYTIVTKDEARELGKNMESAYNLLPSREYFNRVTDPIVLFDDEAEYTDPWRVVWGRAIGNYDELFEFLTDAFDLRVKPTNIQAPEILDFTLLSNADAFHQELDSYATPDNIRTVQVAGWGLNTIKGISYTQFEQYDFPYYVPETTVEGDGTVVYPSALSSDGERFFFIMDDYNKTNLSSISHIDLFGVSEIQGVFESIIKEGVIRENAFIRSVKPAVDNVEDRLLVAVHSPLTLSAQDSHNRFTGADPSNDPDWGVQFVKNDIPNSSYRQYGEGKYLIVPREDSYAFEFEGLDTGVATIVLQTVVADVSATIATFSNILVSETMNATLVVDENTILPEITIDQDGNDVVDNILLPDNTNLQLKTLIAILREKIEQVETTDDIRQALVNHVNLLG